MNRERRISLRFTIRSPISILYIIWLHQACLHRRSGIHHRNSHHHHQDGYRHSTRSAAVTLFRHHSLPTATAATIPPGPAYFCRRGHRSLRPLSPLVAALIRTCELYFQLLLLPRHTFSTALSQPDYAIAAAMLLILLDGLVASSFAGMAEVQRGRIGVGIPPCRN